MFLMWFPQNIRKILATVVVFSIVTPAFTQELKLWYKQPADKWTEAIPLGNGRIGAMIFGGVEKDRIQFNEETLWTGEPREYNRKGAYKYLPQIRQLLFDGKQKEAEKLAEEQFMGLKSNEGKKKEWVDAILGLKSMKGNPANADYNDSEWKEMLVPSYEGWEAIGYEGLDGALWFRTTFELPASWTEKDLVLDLNRIRDHDLTYINGQLIGTMEGTDPRKYKIPGGVVRKGKNTISVHVLNYFDKGGIAGYKDTTRHIGIYPQGEEDRKISLVKKWKYHIQDDAPPAVPRYQADYQPFGDIFLEFDGHENYSNYKRELDLTTAIARTSYVSGGVQFSREYFISQPAQLLVTNITSSRPGSVSFAAVLNSPHKNYSVKKIDNQTISLSVKVRNGALQGESYLHLHTENGTVTVKGDHIIVKNADAATVYLSAATNYRNYKDVTADPPAPNRKAISGLNGKSYTQLRAAHIAEYRKYFNTFSISFGRSENENLPTDERIRRFPSSDDPAFVALYAQYGRYLLISSSRPGTRPANLQGIWNDLLAPPWGSKYTTNINAEMNYWPAELLNLSPMHEPLFKMIEELSVAGRATAREYYNAPGWVLHHNTDLWRGTAPINASNHGIWVTGGAWLAHHLWEHYLYTRDKSFLIQKAYPVMRESARFFNSFLIKDLKTGWLISGPSNSPEQGGLVMGPSMDHQIIRSLFKAVIEASEILGADKSFRDTLQQKLSQVAPDQVGKHGQLQEWLHDVDDPSNKHRHVSHLWGVYPGNEITWDETPELMKAARQSLLYRGDAATGWSLGWKINFWARFRDGDHAYKLIQMLLSPAERGGAGSYPNLFDAHPPFQIDGNFGGAAGIGELLVQSHSKYIDILPALPSALANGEVKGIRSRGGFELDLSWKNGALVSGNILSLAGGDCHLRYNGKTTTLKTLKGKRYQLSDLFDLKNASTRISFSLDENWKTIADDDKEKYKGFEALSYDDSKWLPVNVPHNWDGYEGYRRMRHGNRHGYAWYRKNFSIDPQPAGKKVFLFFEGVGSYATVWVNGKMVGSHPGGRTTFTIDITDVVSFSSDNLLAVRADHPSGIKDLPWVCGGCSEERGFSEGSQPMGIFRPVHLIITNDVRVEPFGVHVWNNASVTKEKAQIFVNTEIKNYSNVSRTITVTHRLLNDKGVELFRSGSVQSVSSGTTVIFRQQPPVIANPRLWSLEDPYLYSLETELSENGKVLDKQTTPYGIRWISWPIGKETTSNQFFLNGKPVFINGIAEYEHLLGNSHAFTSEQVRSRVMQMKAAGFNSFRDAHHPHNLRYHHYWDSLGVLWWTQMGAHIWYDNTEFRKNFKQLLTEWVKERRNSPSNVMWGLQNESKLPEEFARECTELIRQLDPTTSSQRLVTTCNGGTGTDWDVPQNWTGTYGGNPATYSEDVKRQILIGEYGAWRTLDLHTEGPFVQNGPYSEDRMTDLMEMKVRLAEAAKDSTSGHYMWLFTSHDNPGRVQGGEGFRELDRVGPVNYKGLLTPWEEPLDVYYMYRANYASKEKEPMVYIASHTWPDRWVKPGEKDNIKIYSNCDEVELFNDVRTSSLGRKRRGRVGSHFQWDGVNIQYNVLYAVGYVKGKEVAKDYIVLHHLPKSPNFSKFYSDAKKILAPQPRYNYVYRVNCGGAEYIDTYGNLWSADRARKNTDTWGSASWANQFPGMPPFFASQRKTHDPIIGTTDWPLFQTFRYGREQLKYHFPVPDGEYLVELYFTEPWLGTGGGVNAAGWRLFDVAVNNRTVFENLDIWKEAGHDGALKKIIKAKITGGLLTLSFPRVSSGQALISAIAVATLDQKARPAPGPRTIIQDLTAYGWKIYDWAATGDKQFGHLSDQFSYLPSELHGAEWIQTTTSSHSRSGSGKVSFSVSDDADIYVAVQNRSSLPGYERLKDSIVSNAGKIFTVFKRRVVRDSSVFIDSGRELYTVFALPVSTIEPAYDLKPVVSYKAANATLHGPGMVKGQVDGKDRAIFEKASEDNIVEWNFSLGVADMYSLTLSYNNPHAKNMYGKLQLLSADGTVMKKEDVEFTPTRPGKSNYITTNTGNMINAGHYKVRLAAREAAGLSINSLDVQ